MRKSDVKEKSNLELSFEIDGIHKTLKHFNDTLEDIITAVKANRPALDLKSVLAIIGTTVTVTSAVILGIIWLIDSKTLIYAKHMESSQSIINALELKLSRLSSDQHIMANTMGVITDKVADNTAFVNEVIYDKELFTTIGVLKERLNNIERKK